MKRIFLLGMVISLIVVFNACTAGTVDINGTYKANFSFGGADFESILKLERTSIDSFTGTQQASSASVTSTTINVAGKIYDVGTKIELEMYNTDTPDTKDKYDVLDYGKKLKGKDISVQSTAIDIEYIKQ